MDEQHASIWDKVDYSLVKPTTTAAADATASEEAKMRRRRWRRRRIVLDIVSALFWAYALLKVFVTDIDRELVGTVAPSLAWIVAYRWFAFLVLLAVLTIRFREPRLILGALAYVFGFPLLVVFWKLPKALFRLKSWVAALAVINVVSTAIADFKYGALSTIAWFFAVLAVLAGRVHVVLIAGALLAAVLMVLALYRTVTFSVVSPRFMNMQQRTIATIVNSNAIRHATTVGDDLRRVDIEKFNEEQQNTFVSNLALGVFSHRALAFWAYQLDQYRRSPASVAFNAASYLWLLVRVIAALALINYAVYKIDGSQYLLHGRPSLLTFVRYTMTGLYGGEIEAAKPDGDVTNALSIVTFFLGLVVVGTLTLSSFIGFRQTRDDSAIKETINDIRAEGVELDRRLKREYEVTVPEAIERLQQLRYGLLGIIVFISSKIPRGFDQPSEGASGRPSDPTP